MNYDPYTAPIADHSYPHALTAAGATVHAYRQWIDPGDTRGDWLACVTLPDGRSGWIHSWLSTTDEDAFVGCFKAGQEPQDGYLARLAEFSRFLLDDVETREQVEEGVAWCTETGQVDDMLAFIHRVSADVGLPQPPPHDEQPR